MSITAFTQWSATAALNVDLNSIPLSDSMLANQIDGAFQEMMAQLVAAGLATTASATFADNVFKIKGSADATKLVAFEVDGLTTGTTRTITVPDATGTMVLTGATQTLTNKTFTAPVLGAATATSINFGVTSLSAYTEVNETAISQGAGITAGSGSFTSASGDRSYTRVGRLVTVTYNVTITTKGTAATSMVLTLPVNAAAAGGPWAGSAATQNNVVYATIAEGASTAVISDSIGWMGNGVSVILTITYFA